MKIDPNVTAGGGAGAVAVMLDGVSVALFGIPVVAWAAAFSGSLFGMAFFPSDSKVSRPLVVFANMLAAVFLTAIVVAMADAAFAAIGSTLKVSAKPAYIGGVAFVVAVSPLPIIKWIRSKIGVVDA